MSSPLNKYFSKPDFSVHRRLILSIEGAEKQGKTHLALSACTQGKTAFLNFDVGDEGVIHKFEGNDIVTARFDSAPSLLAQRKGESNKFFMEAWQKVRESYEAAIRDEDVKVVIMDTESELYEAIRLGYFGKLQGVLPRYYGDIYAELRKMYRDAYERTDLNLIVTRKLKSEYVNDSRTGKQIPAGFADVAYLTQMNVRVWRDDSGEPALTIDSCRQDSSLAGMELAGEEYCNFDYLLELVHGE
jgi:hypothetical protein